MALAFILGVYGFLRRTLGHSQLRGSSLQAIQCFLGKVDGWWREMVAERFDKCACRHMWIIVHFHKSVHCRRNFCQHSRIAGRRYETPTWTQVSPHS